MLKYPDTDANRKSFKPGLLREILARFDTVRTSRARTSALGGDFLRPERPFRRLAPDDFPVVVVTRNDGTLLPALLRHYRKLGATRFIFVDDQSTDSTRSFLAGQPDVDLWTSALRFGEAKRGRAWRQKLFQIYGKGRWYVNIDADEFLVFADCAKTPLPEVAAALAKRRQYRMAAPMLDLYPTAALDGTAVALEPYQDPWEVADHFDKSGYALRFKKKGLGLQGGPRTRLFGIKVETMKYPLIYADGSTDLADSVHYPMPYHRNFVPIEGVLLHFKIFSDFRLKVREIIQNEQHFGKSKAYRDIERSLDQSGTAPCFQGDVSARYVGVDDLVARGFLLDWRAN